MAPPEPGDAGNPFQSLFGDLMNMLGTNAPDQWEMTRSFALNVATGGEPEANVEPLHRIRLEELARVAELNVTEVTGMPVSPDGRRLTCVPVGRGRLDPAGPRLVGGVLTAMTPVPGPATTPPEGADRTAVDPFAGDDPMGGLGSLLGQWATAIGPMLFGLQVGSVVGHLSHRAMGQYPLSTPLVTVRRAAGGDDQRLRLRRGLEPARGGGAALGVRPRAGGQLGAHPALGAGPAGGAAGGAGPARRRRSNRT